MARPELRREFCLLHIDGTHELLLFALNQKLHDMRARYVRRVSKSGEAEKFEIIVSRDTGLAQSMLVEDSPFSADIDDWKERLSSFNVFGLVILALLRSTSYRNGMHRTTDCNPGLGTIVAVLLKTIWQTVERGKDSASDP